MNWGLKLTERRPSKTPPPPHPPFLRNDWVFTALQTILEPKQCRPPFETKTKTEIPLEMMWSWVPCNSGHLIRKSASLPEQAAPDVSAGQVQAALGPQLSQHRWHSFPHRWLPPYGKNHLLVGIVFFLFTPWLMASPSLMDMPGTVQPFRPRIARCGSSFARSQPGVSVSAAVHRASHSAAFYGDVLRFTERRTELASTSVPHVIGRGTCFSSGEAARESSPWCHRKSSSRAALRERIWEYFCT